MPRGDRRAGTERRRQAVARAKITRLTGTFAPSKGIGTACEAGFWEVRKYHFPTPLLPVLLLFFLQGFKALDRFLDLGEILGVFNGFC